MADATRRGAALAAAGLAPFAAARILYDVDPADLGGLEITCPFRAATGLPCPLCGSTRAVALFSHGDGGWTSYNAVAVVALLAVAVAGIVIALRAVLRRRHPGASMAPGRARRAPVLPAVIGLVAVAWAWTLTHQDTIVG